MKKQTLEFIGTLIIALGIALALVIGMIMIGKDMASKEPKEIEMEIKEEGLIKDIVPLECFKICTEEGGCSEEICIDKGEQE